MSVAYDDVCFCQPPRNIEPRVRSLSLCSLYNSLPPPLPLSVYSMVSFSDCLSCLIDSFGWRYLSASPRNDAALVVKSVFHFLPFVLFVCGSGSLHWPVCVTTRRLQETPKKKGDFLGRQNLVGIFVHKALQRFLSSRKCDYQVIQEISKLS